MPINLILSIKVPDTLHLIWNSSIDINGPFSLSSTILLATVSPSPSIALNGGITSVSLAAPKVIAALLYKSTFKNFIPLAAASKHK